jgi:uncharacterized protein (DUF2141 family)
MKGSQIRFVIVITVISFIILRCAKQGAPTGGVKDIAPPKIIRSIPLNSSVNYSGKHIIVTFDEYVVLDKLNEKFMVSPPMNKKPNIFLRGKSLNIEFQEKLKDSTTYTFYFQDAIKDLNEGNPLNNFQFVFSTGNVIDSLSATGNVYNSFDLEPPENTLIMMYKQLADSAPRKTLPDYITIADINGGFRINNIRDGIYRLYALKDNNNNKKYDLREEGFAFKDTLIVINTAKNYLPAIKDTASAKQNKNKIAVTPLIDGEYKLYLFYAAKKEHYLTSSNRKFSYLLVYTLSIPPDTSKFEFAIENYDGKGFFIEKTPAGDTLAVWLTDSTLYSKPQINTIVRYLFTDTTGVLEYKTDTIPMRYLAGRTTKARAAINKYKVTTKPGSGLLKPGQQIVITSETPFRTPDTTKIRLFEIEKTGKTSIPFSLIKDSSDSHRYYIKTKFKEDRTYLFVADSSVLGDIYGSVTDSVGIKFSVRTTNSYGKLTLNIKNREGDLILQLLDPGEKLVDEKFLKNEGKVEFPLIEKGKYRIRAIYDLNGDRKWNTGDFDLKQQPEPVSYYPDEIEIKVNWEIQQDWDLNKRNQKDQKLRGKKEQNK